ncbi:general transcription factor IIH subunit 4 [Strongylocentrotus purpuratus]|uniref:General transcription factor IIH subunit 4 n=1 Tax=Strongylocentrotus purpuratus TaxID=7668 RepID=A0A7M7PMH7_STRPU|nr:general transcription factor IIH subunit 4 [Strongylocentrotus purpuratus]
MATSSEDAFDNSRKLDCKDLHGYLRTLQGSVLDRLYNHPATCLAVFRELPVLGKHCIMRVLFIDTPIPQAAVTSWIQSNQQEQLHAALKTLTDLRLFRDQSLPGGLPGWLLNLTFRTNLKTALIGGGKPWAISGKGGKGGKDKKVKETATLDKYSSERWECVLHFLVGSSKAVDTLSRDIATVLTHSGLMRLGESGGTPVITPSGFQFLLLDTPSQVWFFMLQYLETSQARGLDIVDALSFLFQLSFSTLGKDYSSEGMTEQQLHFLQHLRELGLVFQRKRKSMRYYPTRLAINLASGVSSMAKDDHKDGFIVVETNFRIYAYTESDLQVEILGLFCSMMYRFPNLSVAALTRESVQLAISNGITAEQILSFLRTHAHPNMRLKTPIVPPTISDQVRLWELERDRLSFTQGIIYNEFLSLHDFEVLRDYAKDLGVLIWDSTARRIMIVSPAGHDSVKKYWKRLKKGQVS